MISLNLSNIKLFYKLEILLNSKTLKIDSELIYILNFYLNLIISTFKQTNKAIQFFNK